MSDVVAAERVRIKTTVETDNAHDFVVGGKYYGTIKKIYCAIRPLGVNGAAFVVNIVTTSNDGKEELMTFTYPLDKVVYIETHNKYMGEFEPFEGDE